MWVDDKTQRCHVDKVWLRTKALGALLEECTGLHNLYKITTLQTG